MHDWSFGIWMQNFQIQGNMDTFHNLNCIVSE